MKKLTQNEICIVRIDSVNIKNWDYDTLNKVLRIKKSKTHNRSKLSFLEPLVDLKLVAMSASCKVLRLQGICLS